MGGCFAEAPNCIGSGIFDAENPAQMAKAIVKAVMNYDKPAVLCDASTCLGEAMKSLEMSELETRFADRESGM